MEGIAEDILSSSLCGEDPPVDALELAACCGLEIVHSDVHGALLYGDAIYVSRRVSIRLLHFVVAHEIGHWALRRDGLPMDDEQGADYLAGALLVPRRSLLRELRAGWDLEALRRTHVHAPASTIAVRVAQVREATAAVYDGTRLRKRVGPPHERELELRDEALRAGRPVRLDDLTGAWPIDTGPWHRVIVLGATG